MLVRSVVELHNDVLHTNPFCSEECRKGFLEQFAPEYAQTNVSLGTVEIPNPTFTVCTDCEQPLL